MGDEPLRILIDTDDSSWRAHCADLPDFALEARTREALERELPRALELFFKAPTPYRILQCSI